MTTQIDSKGAADTSQRAGDGSQQTHITFSDRVSVIAMILAGIAIGVLIVMPSLIDAKIQAGVAKAEATAHAADTNSRVALDKFDELRIELAKKGINVPIN